jgi:uncharacterized protein (TIGR00661 family)
LTIHNRPKKILIAPLDWGLGHATRCIPLIRYFLSLKCDITIAASGNQKTLLQDEFPALTFLELPGYNVVYSRKKRGMPLKILIQIPKILRAIRFERHWLKAIAEKEHFDAVISDNRYGLETRKVRSVFVTHQLQVSAPFKFVETILRKICYKYINKFHECWIPDVSGEPNIAGNLSHPAEMPAVPVKYLGPLSRFESTTRHPVKYKWMVIISGPEPQRTLFEELILKFAQVSAETILIVRGMPGDEIPFPLLPGCTVYNHLNTGEMATAILSSEFIVGLCGYTSIMELLSLRKKSVLVPTPGQTEQEYLSHRLKKQHWCYSFSQDEDFTEHFHNAQQFEFRLPDIDTDAYKTIVENFVTSLP